MATAEIQAHRRAVIKTLESYQGSPDASVLRDTIRQFMQQSDYTMAGRLFNDVLYRSYPSADLDGKLLSLWYLEAVEKSSNPATMIKQAFYIIKNSLKRFTRLGYPLDGVVAAAHFILPRSLAYIFDQADADLMEEYMWLFVRYADHLPELAPDQSVLEQVISRVYLKRHRWDRIGELLVRIQQGNSPSEALFLELFRSAMFVADPRASQFVTGLAEDAVHLASFQQLQDRMTELGKAGVHFGPTAGKALEEILHKHMAPASFLSFLESFNTKLESVKPWEY